MLIVIGLGAFVYGISQHDAALPVMLAGLAIFGVGSDCLMIPISWSAVQTLDADQIAHGSTLFNVNHNTATSVGAALMSVILTSRFKDSPDDLSSAYTGVFVVAMTVVAVAAVPAAFLPKKPSSRMDVPQLDPL